MKHSNFLKVALAILCAAPFFYSCNSSGDNEIDKIDLIPVKLSKDGNWSMINDKGEVVYDGEFKNAPTIAYNGYFSVEEGNGYTLYKDDAKKPEAVKNMEELKSIGYMEDGLIPVVFKNSRITLVNGKGESKFTLDPVKGVEIIQCNPAYKEGLLLVKTDDNKYGYFDTSGKVAIAPDYDEAYDFSEGLAVVGKESKDSTDTRMNYEVINKKGETVFKVKEGYELKSNIYKNGYLRAENDDRHILYDKKGEIVKLPAKIYEIGDMNGQYIIFRNDDYEYGVADIKGEILIRPKYDRIMFNGDESFFAWKKGDEKEIYRLNVKGEEEGKSLDFDMILKFGKFGYLAKDGKTWQLLDNEYKQKGQEDFYDLYMDASHFSVIYSDYFNPASVAKVMVSMLNGDKVGNYKLGNTPEEVLKDKKPSSYTYEASASLPDLSKDGFRYKISAMGYFTETMAYSDYSYYSSSYSWNKSSQLYEVSLNLNCESEWGVDGQKELVNALKEAGFKIVKEGKYEDQNIQVAVAQKGNIFAISSFNENNKNQATLMIITDKVPHVTEYVLNPVLKAIGGKELEVAPTEEVAVAEVTDSVAVDTIR